LLQGAISRAKTVLGAYGGLVTLGLLPLPAAIVAVAVSLIGANPVLALGIALGVSLAANLVLVAFALTRLRRGHRRHPPGTQSPPRPTTYRVPGQLDTIAITSADLEAWWANLMQVLRDKVGPDATAGVEAVHLSDSAFIVFRGSSLAAMKRFSGTVQGPHPDHVSFYGITRVDQPPMTSFDPPLWRTDDSWIELLRRAWIRERPRRTTTVLNEFGSGQERYWRLSFGPYQTDDERSVGTRWYWLRDGELINPAR
jgi:hypothetical protein